MHHCEDCDWRDNQGDCCCPKIGRQDANREFADAIYIDEDYHLWVGPKFGCVHWNKTETEEG